MDSFIQEKYNKHKSDPLQTWLTVCKLFTPGNQGITGVLSLTDDSDKKIVFKISKNMDYLVRHEYNVLSELRKLSFCPHFCKVLGKMECDTDIVLEDNDQLFKPVMSRPVKRDVLLIEYIETDLRFHECIVDTRKVSNSVIYSVVKQVVMAISMAQKNIQLTHYDLHSNNIMMRTCDVDTVFVYVLDESNQFAVASHGYYPVIIDYGYAYTQNSEDTPLWSSLAHTDIGFTSNCFDPIADMKIFLSSVSNEIHIARKNTYTSKLRKHVVSMFKCLNIDTHSGWDRTKGQSAINQISAKLIQLTDASELFTKYENYCFDLIQSLILLPLEKQKTDLDINRIYITFIHEWVKIEKQFLSSYSKVYVLKIVIDTARYVRPGYMDKDTRTDAIRVFRQRIQEKICGYVPFCKLENIQYELLLCSLYILSSNIEGLLFDFMSSIKDIKTNAYGHMSFGNVDSIYGNVETCLKDDYIYTPSSNIIFVDNVKKTTYTFTNISTNQCTVLNKLHPITKGTYLYDLYNSTHT